jgi:hypothetical protein
MSLSGVADSVANLAVSPWLANISWFVPVVQSVHIFAIAIVFTSVVIMSVRVAGLARIVEPARATTSRFLPWVYFALTVLLLSGALLIVVEPHRQLLNVYFQIKMLLLVLFLLVLAGAVRMATMGDQAMQHIDKARRSSRMTGFLAVSLLLAIIWCGRWIAYTQ